MIPDVDPNAIVYLNGQYLPISQAQVSVLDRGFIFGDGIYEVIPIYNGQPFRMEEHLDRLERSLAAISLQPGYSRAQWKELVQGLLSHVSYSHSMVYLQITRGPAKRDHAFPKQVQPTVFGMINPFQRPSERQRTEGLSAIAIPDIRWQLCNIKSVSLLGNVLAKQQAIEAGVDEAIQFRDGMLTEGSSCNIWVVKDGTLLTPPNDHLILEGIRYRLLEELAMQSGVPYQARAISRAEVEQADELLLTAATKEVLPIVRLDSHIVGNGRPGPVYAKLRTAYDALVG
ncbi:D-amino acid aminotransferase [Pusillimonas sp. CC-YST705]|uniref:D-amino acid aminotransferase n=1 Tax=Mesopusillimonas faecipullorum TaxID=2755040 RepID=A0ABS8CF15_9BURK|nr:D-amino acid aminotransferase [Mesopusillimonas faecipullorum]MCB5364635.1 D-amino acid aminotransferase [Mesopusillimonas faecipullorum]